MRRILAALFLMIAAAFGPAGPADASLLGGERSGGSGLGAAPQEESWVSSLPAPIRGAILWTAQQQQAFNKGLRDQIAAYRDQGALAAALALIGLSFLYGVFHAVGPGHGKAVVTTYFLAREATIRRGIALGALIATIQAISAIVIVGGLGLILSGKRTAILGAMPLVEAVSYALVLALGLAMTWAALRGKECDHDHGAGAACGHAHDNSHAHSHDQSHGHGRQHSGPGKRWEFLSAAVVSGLRPCTGALIVLFFALGNGIFLIGAASAFAMAAGVALTVSAIGVAAILARRGLLRLSLVGADGGVAASRRTELALRAFAVLGSLSIAAIGALLLLGATSRGGAL